jgi:uncharacterized protein (TIGR02453 family)
MIHSATLKFLKQLAENNNRDWFNANKNLYISAHENMSHFVDVLITEMNQHDQLENVSGKKSIYRIYNDVRFSKDKSPYSNSFSLSLKRATKYKRGGYYMNVRPGNTYIACGFFAPNVEDLKRIREDIDANYDEWNRILKLKGIKSNYGSIRGAAVLTAPRGYKSDHPAIKLLRLKQFTFRHDFTDEEVLSKNFHKDVAKVYKSIRPFFDYMSEVLTTDANGELMV